MALANKRLALDTKLFWELSKTFNGRQKTNLTVEKALNEINKILPNYSPHRPLIYRCNELSEEIVTNNVTRRKGNNHSKETKIVKSIKERVEK